MLSAVRETLGRRIPSGVTAARRWWALVLPTTLCLAFILSVGPFLQIYVVSLVSSDAPSIYGSAYADSMAPFPPLADWLIAAFDWRFLLVGGLAACAACRSRTCREQGTALAMVCLLGLCAVDVLDFARSGSRDLQQLIVSIGANLVGSVLIAALLLAIFWMHERVAGDAGRAMRAVWLFLSGLTVSLLAHYALLFFYKPLPVRIDLTATHPLSGGYAGYPATSARAPGAASMGKDATASLPRAFGLLPEDALGGRGEVSSPKGRLRVKWRSNSKDTGFVVRFLFFSNCFGPQVGKLSGSGLRFVRSGVRSLELGFDAGPAWLNQAEDARNGFSYAEPEPVLFNTQVEKDGIRISHFSAGRGRLRNIGPERRVFFLNAGLFKSDGGRGIVVPRSLEVIVDGRAQSISFERTGPIEPHAILRCRPLVRPVLMDAHRKSGRLSPFAMRDLMSAGVLIQIDPLPHESTRVFYRPADSVDVTGGNGWLDVAGLDPGKLKDRNLGRTDYVVIDRGLQGLLVEGARVEVRRDQQIVVLGDFRGGYDEAGGFRVLGEAKAAWLDGRRLNPTKWERQPNELRIFILTTLAAGIAGLLKLSGGFVRRLNGAAPLLRP